MALGAPREWLMNLNFNPQDALSIAKAIHSVELTLDGKIHPCHTNQMVLDSADKLRPNSERSLIEAHGQARHYSLAPFGLATLHSHPSTLLRKILLWFSLLTRCSVWMSCRGTNAGTCESMQAGK